MAGEPILAKLSCAPGNNAPIDGVKVVSASGWFAALPSGTEAVYKIYAESFKGEAHVDAIVCEAQAMVNAALMNFGTATPGLDKSPSYWINFLLSLCAAQFLDCTRIKFDRPG